MKEIIRDNEICIYALELEQDKYYVGQSSKFEQRKTEHYLGEGANFTKKYKPQRVIRVFKTRTKNNRKALLIETFITLLFMKRYGWQNVKGGKLLNLNLHKVNLFSIEDRIKYLKLKIRTSDFTPLTKHSLV